MVTNTCVTGQHEENCMSIDKAQEILRLFEMALSFSAIDWAKCLIENAYRPIRLDANP